jgi:hypothetical protein
MYYIDIYSVIVMRKVDITYTPEESVAVAEQPVPSKEERIRKHLEGILKIVDEGEGEQTIDF